MNNIKDKIVQDQYNSEFSYSENKSNLIISFERIAFIFFLFFIIAIIFSLKVIFLSLENEVVTGKVSKKENFRSSIVDKKGNILAKTVTIVNIGINPNLVIDKEKLLVTLKLLFPKFAKKFNFLEISNFVFFQKTSVFDGFWAFWAVNSDSPCFSALVAPFCSPRYALGLKK